jgi:hypothetical protein
VPEKLEGLESIMSTRPRDTSDASWVAQRQILAAMDPSARVQVAIDLSESVRELRIQGLLARNPGWGRPEAVRWLIQRLSS